jgi:hypothetical protein
LSKDSFPVEILFTSSRAWDPRLEEVTFDKYKLRSVPTARESLDDTHESLILGFQDSLEEGQVSSNPEKEGDYILSFLSLVNAMKVEFSSLKLNNVQVTLRSRRSSFLIGKMDSSVDLGELCRKLKSLDQDILRQYLRGCSAYRTALSLIEDNPTLSFFLLVTAIEAVSHKVMRTGDQRKDFVEFILKYLPRSFEDELGDKGLLLLLIDEAYNMRCAFTHGGTEISIGTLSADRVQRKYVKHMVKDKEVYSPSISWFAGVVQATLMQFILDQKAAEGHASILSDLAREEGIIYVRAAGKVEAGQVVTAKDVDLEFQKKS